MVNGQDTRFAGTRRKVAAAAGRISFSLPLIELTTVQCRMDIFMYVAQRNFTVVLVARTRTQRHRHRHTLRGGVTPKYSARWCDSIQNRTILLPWEPVARIDSCTGVANGDDDEEEENEETLVWLVFCGVQLFNVIFDRSFRMVSNGSRYLEECTVIRSDKLFSC